VLADRGLYDEIITRPEESYGLWCVVVRDLENLVNVVALDQWGLLRHKKKKKEKLNIGHKSHITCQFTDILQLEF
jgi:hypothetical protein